MRNIVMVLAALLLTLGCSKKDAGYSGGVAATNFERSSMTQSFDYDDSAVLFKGTGFNPEEPAGIEGRTPPAFRDMSHLDGRSREESAAQYAGGTEIERKLVKRANIRIRVENLEAADASIADLLARYDAYAASTYIEENSHRYSLRVPSPLYDAFLAEMNGMGRLLSRSENTEDVTLRYYDLEGRLATKKGLLQTFQSYLGKAKNIEEILSVEARIADLQNDIEGTGMQLRNLANRVDYATIDLDLWGPVAAIPHRSATFGERIKTLFSGFGGFLSGAAMVILGIVIYGIPVLLLIVFFFWLLLGRIGLLKKLWRLVMGKKQST